MWSVIFCLHNKSLISTVKKCSVPESNNISTVDSCIFCDYLEKQRFWSPHADLATVSDSATCKVSPEIYLDVFQINLNFHIYK